MEMIIPIIIFLTLLVNSACNQRKMFQDERSLDRGRKVEVSNSNLTLKHTCKLFVVLNNIWQRGCDTHVKSMNVC